MPHSPFPGMDPYLESPDIWPDVHHSLMDIFREQLTPLLAPKYLAELHVQLVIEYLADDTGTLEAEPDVAVIKPNVLVLDRMAEAAVSEPPLRLRAPLGIPRQLASIYIKQRERQRLVAVIEVLSPVNKRPGPKRRAYLKKRNRYIDSPVHLVEIDLLRRWPRMPLADPLPKCDYLVMLHNSYDRVYCGVWPISIRDRLPTVHIPLLKPDPAVPLALGQALRTSYERARYDLRINYRSPPDPPLSPADAEWAQTLLAEQNSKS